MKFSQKGEPLYLYKRPACGKSYLCNVQYNLYAPHTYLCVACVYRTSLCGLQVKDFHWVVLHGDVFVSYIAVTVDVYFQTVFYKSTTNKHLHTW